MKQLELPEIPPPLTLEELIYLFVLEHPDEFETKMTENGPAIRIKKVDKKTPTHGRVPEYKWDESKL